MKMKKLPPLEAFVSVVFSRRRALSGFGLGLFVALLIFTLISVGSDSGVADVDASGSMLLWIFSVTPVVRSPHPQEFWLPGRKDRVVEQSREVNCGTGTAYGRKADVEGRSGGSPPAVSGGGGGNSEMIHGDNVSAGNGSWSSRDKTQGDHLLKRGGSNGNSTVGNITSIDSGSTPLKSHKGSSSSSKTSSTNGNEKTGNADILHGARDGSGMSGSANVKPGISATLQVSSSGRIHSGLDGKCDIFEGRWVRDESKPYYPPGSCPYLDQDFNCQDNGRPDDDFLKWRWQPNECKIPSLNATDFLRRLSGQRLIFVGDSLNRNMWESLVCILRHSLRNKDRVYEMSGRRQFKTSGYYSFIFEDYNCSVDFVRSPFLVREVFNVSLTGSEGEKLRLDLMDRTTSAYHKADIVVFNTGHWWTHEKTSKGINYYQEGDHVYPILNVMEAYKKALWTWARWVDENIDPTKTQVIFRGYSRTHFSGGQWNSGGQCHQETEPIFNQSFLRDHPEKMTVLEQVLKRMKTPVIYLNVSRLTDYRKDGHPSIYRKNFKTSTDQIALQKPQDCSHWCLPGVPDAWNELLYAALLAAGRGSWAAQSDA